MARSAAWDGVIELRHLRYFVAAAKTGSFSDAAREQHVSQPSVSDAVSDLEAKLHARLFERHTKGVSLTATGQFLLERARSMISQLDQTVDEVKMLGGPSTVRHVGYSGSPTAGFREAAIAALEQTFPGLVLVPRNLAVKDCVKSVSAGEVDFALSLKPADRLPRNLRFVPLTSCLLFCAVSDTRHQFAREKHMPLNQLRDEKLLIFSRISTPQYIQDLERVLKRHQIEPKILQEYGSPDDVAVGIAGGHGVALLLEPTRRSMNNGIAWLPLKPALPRFRIGALFKKSACDDLLKIIAALTAWAKSANVPHFEAVKNSSARSSVDVPK